MISKSIFLQRSMLLAVLWAIGSVAMSSAIAAPAALSAEQRLNRLENLLSNQVLMEQSQRLGQIQQELTSLRGLLETQAHQLGMIKQRQRNLYQDMDRRLNDLEIQGGGVALSSNEAMATALPAASSSVPPPSAAIGPVSIGSAIAAPQPQADKNGKSAYSLAFNTLKEGKYQQAILAFKAFQQAYPESIYGANAQYWLGEAYSVTREYQTALGEFQKVISQYPKSSKVEGAMLKLGYTYYEMRDWTSAKAALDAVIEKFPGTTVTRKAKERLQRMKREGH